MGIDTPLYRVVFTQEEKTYEIYARSLSEESLMGFIEVEEFVFGDEQAVLVDPTEERLKNEFQGVKRSYIPMHMILRIDEMEPKGTAVLKENPGLDNIHQFPGAHKKPASNKDI